MEMVRIGDCRYDTCSPWANTENEFNYDWKTFSNNNFSFFNRIFIFCLTALATAEGEQGYIYVPAKNGKETNFVWVERKKKRNLLAINCRPKKELMI